MIWSPCNFASIADSRGDGLLVMSKRVGNFRHNLAAASQKIIMMRMTSGLASSPWCVAFSSISLGDLTQWTHCLLLLEKYISSPWTLWSEFQRNCSKLFKMLVCLIQGYGVSLFSYISLGDLSQWTHCHWKNTSAAPRHNGMNLKQIGQNVCVLYLKGWPHPPGATISPWSFVLCIHVSQISENKLVVPQFEKKPGASKYTKDWLLIMK